MAYIAIGMAGGDTEFRSKILEVWTDLVAVTYGETPGKSKEKTQEEQWREDYAKIRATSPKIQVIRDEHRHVTGVVLKDIVL